MARHIDWDKVRKSRIVWERGGIPVWQDGWGKEQESHALGKPVKNPLRDAKPLDFKAELTTVTIDLVSAKGPETYSLVYKFHAFHPGDEILFKRMLDEFVSTSDPGALFQSMEDWLLTRYKQFHNEIRSSVNHRGWYKELQPRKLRRNK